MPGPGVAEDDACRWSDEDEVVLVVLAEGVADRNVIARTDDVTRRELVCVVRQRDLSNANGEQPEGRCQKSCTNPSCRDAAHPRSR